MRFEELNKEVQEYIDRYIRGKPITREQAMKDNLIWAVCRAYENGELKKKSKAVF